MRCIILISMLCFIVNSCSGQISKNKKDKMHEPYIYDFKMTYFKKLLNEAFSNKKAINQVLAADRSGYSEPILSSEDYSFIDSLVKADNQRMIRDSIDRIGKVSEGAQGKRIFDFALSRYNSNWLKQMAESRYKIYYRKQADD